jgi:hypothetical protein
MSKPPTFFPELTGDEQIEADEWLHNYLRLVLGVIAEEQARTSLTNPEVLARSVRPDSPATIQPTE